MISGSYTGGISFFKGLGGGNYAEARKLSRPDGKPISDEYAQTPCLSDWDGDGDWDMAIGVIDGPVKLYLNSGDMTFVESGPFKAKGIEIKASDGGPCLVDWDGDGVLDLLLGDGNGNVMFYKGTAKGSLEMAAGSHVLPARKGAQAWEPRLPDPKSKVGFRPAMPGARVKPFAADWNGDGKLDLLVGDYIQVAKEARKLTAAEQKRLSQLEKRRTELEKKLTPMNERIYNAALKAIGKKPGDPIAKEEMESYSKAYEEARKKEKDYQPVWKEWSSLWTEIYKLRPQSEGTGFVWVYLRK